jgi:hypothetical protein
MSVTQTPKKVIETERKKEEDMTGLRGLLALLLLMMTALTARAAEPIKIGMVCR